MWIYKLILPLIIISWATSVYAQDTTFPQPEIEQMHRNAELYTRMGNWKLAIITYKQLMTLAPGKEIFKTELADIYFRSGDYSAAEQELELVITTQGSTDVTYQLLAACQLARKQDKKAAKTIAAGLDKFPSSGILYHQQGIIYQHQGNLALAAGAWISGINVAPGFAPNYKNVATAYLATNNVLWGLIYGEIYLSMRHQTFDDSEIKHALYTGWSTYFNNLTKEKPTDHESQFELSVNDIYVGLTPVISDGISTENLVMAHTRFLMKWFSKQNEAFVLFAYQDSLLRDGWFDIYMQQLYGNAESSLQYDAWYKFHKTDIDRFNSWQNTHRLMPVSLPLHISNDPASLRSIFGKKKKR